MKRLEDEMKSLSSVVADRYNPIFNDVKSCENNCAIYTEKIVKLELRLHEVETELSKQLSGTQLACHLLIITAF